MNYNDLTKKQQDAVFNHYYDREWKSYTELVDNTLNYLDTRYGIYTTYTYDEDEHKLAIYTVSVNIQELEELTDKFSYSDIIEKSKYRFNPDESDSIFAELYAQTKTLLQQYTDAMEETKRQYEDEDEDVISQALAPVIRQYDAQYEQAVREVLSKWIRNTIQNIKDYAIEDAEDAEDWEIEEILTEAGEL